MTPEEVIKLRFPPGELVDLNGEVRVVTDVSKDEQGNMSVTTRDATPEEVDTAEKIRAGQL